jgi:hypothetical protein
MKKWFLPTMALLVLGILLMPTTLAEGNVKVNDFSSNVTNGTVTLETRFTEVYIYKRSNRKYYLQWWKR